ncbi:MAG: hypothetical protein ACFCVH_21840 [Alphaproteobacteria bacterium]
MKQALCILAISLGFASPAAAQDAACNGIAELYEEAAARIGMIQTRNGLRREFREATTPREVFVRLDNEIAALAVMGGDDGLSLEGVTQRYLECRFELARGITDLPAGPPTVVASNCPACTVKVAATNDALETLHALAQQPESTGTLRHLLTDRMQQIGELLTCEQSLCRDPWAKRIAQPLSVEDYLRDARAAADPRAWANEPIVVSALPDYAVPQSPIAVYPASQPQ